MILEQADQHPGEAEHRVGHLTGLGGEVVGQRVEGPVCDRVAVDQGEGRHTATPRTPTDTFLCGFVQLGFARIRTEWLFRETGEELGPFVDQLGALLVEEGERLLESPDVGGGQAGLLTIDVIAHRGVSLGVVVDRAVILQLGLDLTRLGLERGDLLIESEETSVNAFQLVPAYGASLAYSTFRPYTWNLAGVAELADALDSKSSVLRGVWVRVPPPAPRS